MKFHCSCYTFFSSELNWSIFWYSLKRELYNFILWGPLLLVFTKLSLTASYMCESVVFNTTTRVRPKNNFSFHKTLSSVLAFSFFVPSLSIILMQGLYSVSFVVLLFLAPILCTMSCAIRVGLFTHTNSVFRRKKMISTGYLCRVSIFLALLLTHSFILN